MTIITGGVWPINPNVETGTDLATHLNELVQAINSSQASASRPPMIAKGGVWAKTAGATNISIMFFDGAVDHEIGSVIGGVAKFGGATFNSGATATKPATSAKGDIFFDTTLNRAEFYDGGAWKFGGATFNSGATATKPTTPVKGDMFYDTTLNRLEVYDGGAWKTNASSSGVITSGTAVASTSGTSIDFTSIPSWVKRIIILFNGVSTNGTSTTQIQIGSGSFTTSGYASAAASSRLANTNGVTTITSGFVAVYNPPSAASLYSGQIALTNITGNAWVEAGNTVASGSGDATQSAGSITLGGTLDRVRITTVNGTDTFDAGSINILYE